MKLINHSCPRQLFPCYRAVLSTVLVLSLGCFSPSNAQVLPATTVGTVISVIASALLLDCDIPGFTPEQCEDVIQTQSQADAFEGVTRIEGSLFISGLGDLDFSPFDSLEEVTGQILIIYGRQSSVIGFDQLQSVGFGIKIANNSGLTTVAGFNGLSGFSVSSGALEIEDNPQLTQVSGFSNLQTTNRLEILRNPQLQTLTRFNGLNSVSTDLKIEDNPSLTAIRGFNSLQNVGNTNGSLSILDNTGLSTIDAFPSLDSIKSFLSIRGNNQLSTLSGFNVLQSVNTFLLTQMNVSTLPSFSQLATVGNTLSLDDLPLLSQVPTFPALNSLTRISLRRLGLVTEISGFNNVPSLTFALNIGSNPNLVTISGFNALNQVGNPGLASIPTFEIRINDKLDIVTGFDQLDHSEIDGQIYVERNPLLNCPLYLDELEPMTFSADNEINCSTGP